MFVFGYQKTHKTSIGPPVNIENVSRNGVGSMTSIEIDFQFVGFDLRISIQKRHVEATLKGKVVFRGEQRGVFDTPTRVTIIARISIGRQFMALQGADLCK